MLHMLERTWHEYDVVSKTTVITVITVFTTMPVLRAFLTLYFSNEQRTHTTLAAPLTTALPAREEALAGERLANEQRA
jgi:hypothetical protein